MGFVRTRARRRDTWRPVRVGVCAALVLAAVCSACAALGTTGPLPALRVKPLVTEQGDSRRCPPEVAAPSLQCAQVEVATLAPTDEMPVLAMRFERDAQSIVVVQAPAAGGRGVLRRWDLTSATPVATHDLGSLAPFGASFSEDGSVLATIMLEDSTTLGFRGRRGGGVSIWDSNTGQLERTLRSGLIVDHAAVSADGKWLVSTGQSFGFTVDPLTATAGGSAQGGAEIDETGHVVSGTKIAVDAVGEVWAYAMANGEVRLESRWTPNSRQILMGWRGQDDVLDLQFDRSRQHLAILRERQLVLSNLSYPFHLREVSIPLPPARTGVLSFSPTGEWLAIGTELGWELRSTVDLRTAARGETATTALAFSPSGCLWAVGDVSGVVRVFACQ